MFDLILQENGRLALLLPDGRLEGLFCRANLEDQGEIDLLPGQPERTENEVIVPLRQEAGRVSGRLILRTLNDTAALWLELSIAQATFEAIAAFNAQHSASLYISALPGQKRLLADYLEKAWWTAPAFPTRLEDVPEKTQMLLAQTENAHAFILPLVCDGFKADLSGSPQGLRLSAHLNQYGLDRLSGPLAAFTSDADPFTAVQNAFADCVEAHLIHTPLKAEKQYPEMMEYLGWCSWNAFYRDVTAEGLENKLKEFKEKNLPIRWMIIDDGWSSVKDERLTALTENQEKFPQGLKGFIRRAHEQYGVSEVGVWHAFNAYWNGVHPDSSLAREMAASLSETKTGHLVPGFTFQKAFNFYDTWHRYLRNQGVDFLKVDNQSSWVFYLRNNAAFQAARTAHEALEASVKLNFPGPLINCMGMANEDEFFREYSAVSRNSDDFFPDQQGSFVHHLMQNAYNAVFHDQLFICDYDMWWTQHESAVVSGVLRAISGGPIYISDKVGETDAAMLMPLIEKDGRILRCDHAVIPARSCLFENVPEESGVLKVTNRCGANVVTAAFNLAPGERACQISREDTECEPGVRYLAYLHFAKRYIPFDAPISLTLPENGVEIVNLYPIENGRAQVGDESKYVSAASQDTHIVTVE